VQPSAGLAAGTRFDVSYAGNSLDLFVTPASFANLSALGGAVTRNRAAVGGAIDALRGPAGPALTGDTATVINAFYGTSVSGMGAALDQMAGTVHGDAMTAALSANRMFAFSDGNWDGGPTMTASLLGAGHDFAALNVLAGPQPASLSGSPFWARAAGQWINTTSDGRAPGYTANAGGAVAGFDLVRDADTRFGFAGAYIVSDVTTKIGATANVQGGRAFAYGTKIIGSWRFDHEVSLGFDGYHTRRVITIGGLARIATGKADGFNVSADLAAHYDLGFAVPFGEFRYDRIHRDGFTETGAGVISLAVAGADLDAPRLLAGADFDLMRTFGRPSPDWGANLRRAWAHDFDGTLGVTDSALTGAPANRFTVFSSKPGNDAGLLDLRASTGIGDGFALFGAYKLEARDRQITQGVSLGLRATW